MIQGTACQEHQCGTCGVWFAIPDIIIDSCRREGGFFSCPNGHSRGWEKKDCETETDKIRRERDRLQQRLAQKDDDIAFQREQRAAAERSAIAYKGQATRLRKHAKAGTCPCCKRTFRQLALHMKHKHPDFSPEAPELKVVAGGKPA
jgi:3-mercaptopyruvate sulfurtransferase SseA